MKIKMASPCQGASEKDYGEEIRIETMAIVLCPWTRIIKEDKITK